MANLTADDIALGRNALAQGMLTRPQLDAGVELVRSGQAPDLGRALLMCGSLQAAQLEQLRPAGSGYVGSEAETLHDPLAPGSSPGVSGPYGSAPGGSGYGPAGPYGTAGLGDPGPYGSAPGGSGYGPGGSGYGPGGSAYGPGGSGYGPGGSAYGPGGSAYGPGGTSPYGTGPGGSAYGPGGTSPYGTGPGGSAYGTGPGGTSPYGTGPGGSAYGTGPGGTAPYGTGPGGTAPYGTGPGGTSPYGTGPGSSYGTGGYAGSGFLGSAASDAIGQQIGDWTVRREIARGGMAVVYEAANEGGERAAIKVLMPAGGEVTEKKLRRFMREIDANKRLDHPGIARIIDSGVVNGYPYFSMEYVEGKSLDRLLKDDLDLEIGMEILERMALAIHYAHEQGIIHRDLKPANVLVMEEEDDLYPKITDFGLAKTADESSSLTRTGAVIGTPYYLSPEQAQGLSEEVDQRADVYALGVIMYELATGRLPFVGQTTVELYNRIVNDDPVPPTKFKPQLTRALETVCLKAMAKDPADRYQTAEEFAADVKALLAGSQISAKMEGRVARAMKSVRKRATLGSVLIATSVILVLVVGGVFALYLRQVKIDTKTMQETELAALGDLLDKSLGECEQKLDESRQLLREHKIPAAVTASKETRDMLHEVEGKLNEGVSFPANQEPARKLLEHQLSRRQTIEAAALVVLAKSTMQLDEGEAINEAQGMLEHALEVREGDPAATTAQGDLNVLIGKLDDAVESYDEVLGAHDSFLPALVGKAKALYLREEFAQVLPMAGQAIRVLEDEKGLPTWMQGEDGAAEREQLLGELKLLRARTYRETGEYEKGLHEVAEVEKKHPDWWRAKACEGRLLALQGFHFKARDALTEAVEMAGDGSERAGPLVQRAEVLLSIGLSAEALHDAAEATDYDPGSLEAVVVRAEAAEYQLLFKDALQDASGVLVRARERHWQVAGRAARIQARLEAIEGRVKEALEYARKAADFDEYSSQGRLLLARLQLDPVFDDQYLEDAEENFKAVLQQRPDSLQAKRGLGLIQLLKHSREPERAKSKLEEALEQDKDDPWALSALARVYGKLDDETRSEGYTVRAARYERDVRRPEGYAYALGVRQEKLAQHASGRAEADHINEATRGFRWAAWLDPYHTQALTGLAQIAYELGDYKLAGARLERALDADPKNVAAILLNARYNSAQDVWSNDIRKAMQAVSTALEQRGETPELHLLDAQLKAYQAIRGGAGAGAGTEEVSLADCMKAARQAAIDLRKAEPWNLASYRSERDLERNLGDNHEDLAEAAQKRFDTLRSHESDLRKSMQDRLETAKQKLEEAQAQLEKGELKEAFKAALYATRYAPWDAGVWSGCADVRARVGDAWAAVGAGIRAAYLDDDHVPELFGLLRVAGQQKDFEDAAVAERLVSMDAKSLPPLSDDLRTLYQAAPVVARSLVSEIDMEAAKDTKTRLEEVIAHDPTQLTAHALLGLLAYGGGNEELAIQHLLFVATVNERAGEGFYLAAVAASARSNASRQDDVQAIEWLQRATSAQFTRWPDLAKDEPKLARLKKSDLWQRLPEAHQAE